MAETKASTWASTSIVSLAPEPDLLDVNICFKAQDILTTHRINDDIMTEARVEKRLDGIKEQQRAGRGVCRGRKNLSANIGRPPGGLPSCHTQANLLRASSSAARLVAIPARSALRNTSVKVSAMASTRPSTASAGSPKYSAQTLIMPPALIT